VAVALQDGAVTPDSFGPQRLDDPTLRTLMARVSIEEDSEFTRRFPVEFGCRMELRTGSGRGLVASTSFPKGHPHNPLSDSEIEDKFRGLAAGVLSERQRDDALRMMWSLQSLSDLDELFDSLVVSRP
jgi:2-methylcitrate dehydratase